MNLQLAEEIWVTTNETSFIHPRGHQLGWAEIKADFYGKTMDATFSEQKLVPRDVKINVYGDSAYVEFYWDFEARLRQDGQIIHTAGRETQLLLRTPSGWRIAHVHYSSMPVTGAREGF